MINVILRKLTNWVSAHLLENKTMKYVYTVSKPTAFTLEQASAVFPTSFSFQEEDGQLLLAVTPPSDFTDEQVFNQVQQECDRLFFLTGGQLDPKLLRKETPAGPVTNFRSFTMGAVLVKPLGTEIERQQWQASLPVQLRLWQLAQLPNLPVATQINLLFQIIEISYPSTNDQSVYPQYSSTHSPPHPRTEAKLLRDLASHGKKRMGSRQVQLYCQYLGISDESHDPTDSNFIQVLRNRLQVIQVEARKVIDDSITRKP